MGWHPIDFQGIIGLDRKVVEQLAQFLQEKENQLAQRILNAIQTVPEEASSPALPEGASLKLSGAIEEFTKKVQRAEENPSDNEKRNEESLWTIKEINAALWEFTEILEGSVSELFRQVQQLPIDRWDISTSNVIHEIRDILFNRLEDLIWIVRRLEKPLKEYGRKSQAKKSQWLAWKPFEKSYLDSHLLGNLQKSQKFLKEQYEVFNRRYNAYKLLNKKVDEDLEKLKSYPILALFDVHDHQLYVDLFRLLKMGELNRHTKKRIGPEIIRSLKRLSSIDNILRLFRNYICAIKEAFFNSSLEWKSLNREGENFKEALEKLQNKIKEYRQELEQLLQAMGSYRTFILKNESNPYLRSRWGFTEWIVGPEPAKAKELQKMIYSAKELDDDFTHFSSSLARDPLNSQQQEYQALREIQKILHEMGQPLISRSMMNGRAEQLLEKLKACDEVGSSRMSIIHEVEDILSKALREDWKYDVLQSFPLFHHIYHLHQGLAEDFDDPAHAFRLERFRLLFDQIKGWVEKRNIDAHAQEVELDINDMKTYLQDFLATVQRAVKDKSQNPFLDETMHKFRQQLLEYRYLFGQFFSSIKPKSEEGPHLRNQFLFVNQYFESVENLLHELK